ncbi:MAG: hypothetical protein U9Q37_02585 [Euryarchaeota archaeon]|nr:hypothetical protein [Euryarchaeota archaeon]
MASCVQPTGTNGQTWNHEEPGFKKKVRHQKVYECDEFGISGAFEIIGKAENKMGTTSGGCG